MHWDPIFRTLVWTTALLQFIAEDNKKIYHVKWQWFHNFIEAANNIFAYFSSVFVGRSTLDQDFFFFLTNFL